MLLCPQTGPKNEWLVDAYIKAAPYPHAYVLAQVRRPHTARGRIGRAPLLALGLDTDMHFPR